MKAQNPDVLAKLWGRSMLRPISPTCRRYSPPSSAGLTDQNVSFSPNWIYRGGSRSLLITPKPPVPNVVFGFEKCGVLNKLKKFASNRSCWLSVNSVVDFASEKSQLPIPGPNTCPIPEFPNVKAGGVAQQLVLNHSLTNFGIETLLQVISAGLLPPLLFSRFVADVICSGVPDWYVIIPLAVHPLTRPSCPYRKPHPL
jgi:hypothetical protein